MRRSTGTYPADWPAIARQVKDAANWCCVRCTAYHDPPRVVLTVHHLDMSPSHNSWYNLVPLCARCHLQIQAKVDLSRPWIFDHSAWARPYMAGHYARLYLGIELTRSEVEARLEELLALESQAVIGMPPLAMGAS